MCQIMAEGGFMRVGRTVWNTLKAGGTEKSVEKTKILKRSGQAGSSVGCLKKKKQGELEPPYELNLIYPSWYMKKFVPNFILKYAVHFWLKPGN